MQQQPIGTTQGPGERPHEYLFVTPDPQQRAKHGEFVYYEALIDGQQRAILGRIIGRQPIRLYPNALLADPLVPPGEVAELLGIDSGHELYQVTVAIIGYYTDGLGFVNPRIPPRPGAPILLVPDDMLAGTLCRLGPQQRGAVHIGSLLSRPAGQVPVALDAREFTSTHLAIIASTGAGKSYLAGVMIEELLSPHNRAAVLIIDPHAEYDTLDELQGHPAFCQAGYRPSVKVVRPQDIHVRVSSLEFGDLRYLLPEMTDKMMHQLRQALQQVRRQHGDNWTRSDLQVAIRAQGGQPVTDPDEDDRLDPTIAALLWRLDSVLDRNSIFDDDLDLELRELFRPGRCTMLQLDEINERDQCIVVATLLRRLYRARMNTVRGRLDSRDRDHLPYPAFVLLEEAHTYAPAGGDQVTSTILKQILSEGRKFGVAVGLISQRPGKLDADVLSQCMTQCIMRIVNPVDQARIAESVESVGRDLLDELPALSKGQVIVAGAAVNSPVLVQVRQRLTRHGAESPDAPAEWLAYFDQRQQRQRARDDAPPADSPPDVPRLYR
jgi:hypothetical protein